MTRPAPRMLQFGKLPSRGDFVRSGEPAALIQTLDGWLAGGVEALAAEPRWKLLYDRTPPTSFAFLGSRSNRALAGHLIASSDASGRRFPFIAAVAVEARAPLDFLALSPTLLAAAWRGCAAAADGAHAAAEAAALPAEPIDAVFDAHALEAEGARFRERLGTESLASAEALLHASGHEVDLRQLLLGLGLLLQPVLASGIERLAKGLALPLPAVPAQRPFIAALWMTLVAPFLARAGFEVLLLLPDEAGRPELLLGFEGPSVRGLQALFDTQQRAQVFIDATRAEWVENCIDQDYGVKKLSSHLAQPSLSLAQAVSSFNEAFFGG